MRLKPRRPARDGWQAALGLAAALAVGVADTAPAATLTDPALVTGGESIIDPTGELEDADQTASGATAQSVLEDGNPQFQSVQDFTGFVEGANTIVFTDASLPDIRITPAGSSIGDTGRATNGGVVRSSDGAALRLNQTAAGTLTLTIDFGSADGDAWVSDTNAVKAAGFMLVQAAANLQDITAIFRDDAGNTLSTQTAVGQSHTDGSGNHRDLYFGFESPDFAIGSIELSLTRSGSGVSGLDDLGFTIVPEPGALGLIGTGAGLLLSARRRDRRAS